MGKYLLSIFLILLGFALLESAVLSNIIFLPVIPDFLLICVIYYSFQHGKTIGETSGFMSGLFIDFLSGCPFGLNCLLRTVIGYVCGFFNRTFAMEGFLVPAALSLVATIFKVLLTQIISLFYPSVVNSYHIFSLDFGFELLMNTLFAPVIVKFLGFFDDLFPLQEKL